MKASFFYRDIRGLGVCASKARSLCPSESKRLDSGLALPPFRSETVPAWPSYDLLQRVLLTSLYSGNMPAHKEGVCPPLRRSRNSAPLISPDANYGGRSPRYHPSHID